MSRAEQRVRANPVEPLLRQLGYAFTNPELLQQALTHRSSGPQHNERLEFLGDAVLSCIISHALYQQCGQADEGELSRLRAYLVCEPRLAEIARELQLGEYLHFGPGENDSGSWRRDSVLADALEALIGALFLDGGMDCARTQVLQLYATRLQALPSAESLKDAKTRLQEYLQARSLALPEYSVVAVSGPPHKQRFSVQASVPGLVPVAAGIGRSRRMAEQEAANQLLQQLQDAGLAAP